MGAQAYVLIQPQCGNQEVIGKLRSLEGVKCADGITGEYDIIAFVSGESMVAVGKIVGEQIHENGGVRTVTHPIPNGHEFREDELGEVTYAYVFVDVQMGVGGTVVTELRKLPEVRSAVTVLGELDIIACVAGENLQEIDVLVRERIQGIQGVTNTTTLVVMNLDSRHKKKVF
jgi:DNA-binding Lrp family transcriptional regulator